MSLWSKFLARVTTRRQVYPPKRNFLRKSRVFVDEDSAMQVAAFHRGIVYISTQMAKLPWEMKDKNNNILDNKVANLLNLAPNSEMNAYTFRMLAIQTAIIHGNFYAEIERNLAGTPIALWPLVSHFVFPQRNLHTLELEYRVTGNLTGSDVFLKPSDIFHLKNFHTKDGIIGQGLKDFAIQTLGITLAADQMASGIFNSGGVPSGVITVPGTMSDEAYLRLKKSWDDQNGGGQAGGTSILEEGTTYSPVNTTPDVLQFLESRKFGVLEIARFLGLTPIKLFDDQSSTYRNLENSNLEVATDTLHAWARNLEMEADVKILNNRYGGNYTELDLYSVFRGDMNSRASYFKSLMQCAAITPNQVRAREGLAGFGPDGDRYFVATNNFTPIDRMDEVIDSQIKSKLKPPNNPTPQPAPAPKPKQSAEFENAVIEFLKK